MEDTGAHVVDTTVDAIAEPVESSATPERTSEGTAADNGHNGGGDNDNEANDGNSGEEIPDMMAILYGNEEEADADDDEDDFVANTTTVSQESNTGSVGGVVKAEVVGTAGVAEGLSTGAADSGRKRRSNEANDSSQNNSKRIKPEPMSPPRSRSQESVPLVATIPLTTTCEQIEVEEELPKDSRHFMTYILSLSGNDLEAKDMTELSIHSKLNDITRTLEFRSMDTFLESFVPFVIMDLWRNAKQEWGSRPKRVLGRKCSIMTKWKTNRMFDGLELKCISVIGSDEKPHFRFGQLAMLQTAIQTKADSNQHTIGRRKCLAYITSHTVRETNPNNQTEVNHLRTFSKAEKRPYSMVEEITFMTKYGDDLYIRNDSLLIADPMICIHNYVLQVRALYKFDQFPAYNQVFRPIFTSRASGLSVRIDEKRYDSREQECIQTALDVVANPSASHSYFLLVKGSEKTNILGEIVRQIVLCDSFRQMKVLVTSNDENSLKSINNFLKSRRISTYFTVKDVSELRDPAIKYINHKLSKPLDEHQKGLYEDCLQYLEQDIHFDVSVDLILQLNKIYEQLKRDLMFNSHVIMGRVDDLCNDISFYNLFASHKFPISCCVVEDSAALSEPQIYSLFWFGVNKIIFGRNSYDRNIDKSDVCVKYGLSRSLCGRYLASYRHIKSNNSSLQSLNTVFEFGNSISD